MSSPTLESIGAQFPALQQEVNGRRLAYLDNAATTQKPDSVLRAMDDYYRNDNSNVHRGVHTLSMRATERFDRARHQLADFIGAPTASSLAWTKGCTEAINFVASTWGLQNIKSGDRILLSAMEHHANIVPWQWVAEKVGATVEPIPINDVGELLLEEFNSLLDERVRFVGIKHVCNALGTINPVREATELAHQYGAKVLADGAQALAHLPVNIAELGVDFYSISAHKAYGPTGVGAIYIAPELIKDLPPYQYGGDMIRQVRWSGTTYADPPNRFEPGTPNIAGVIGFGAAIEFLNAQDSESLIRHESQLVESATHRLQEIPGCRVVGTAKRKTAVASFVVEGVHPHDIGTILDQYGVAIRAGHHCCMPLMERLGVPATARASFSLYNTMEDVDRLVEAVAAAQRMFQ